MKTTNMFAIRRVENNPVVIVGDNFDTNRPSFTAKPLVGKFYRVSPTTWREVAALQMLVHQHEKYAPAAGNGIIVTVAALDSFTTNTHH